MQASEEEEENEQLRRLARSIETHVLRVASEGGRVSLAFGWRVRPETAAAFKAERERILPGLAPNYKFEVVSNASMLMFEMTPLRVHVHDVAMAMDCQKI